MAKKKPESGPGTFMIIALVFFVLTSAILGVTTYLGFDGQTELQNKEKAATDEKNKLQARVAEETARRDLLRIAVGSDDPQDREDLRGAMNANKAAILEEHKKLMDKVGSAAQVGGKNVFWPIGADGEPTPAPAKTIPQLARLWADMYRDLETKYKTEQAAHARTLEAKVAADQRAKDQKDQFDAQMADLRKEMDKKNADMEKAFQALKTIADAKGGDFKKAMDDWSNSKAQLDEQINSLRAEIKVWQDKYNRLLTQDPSDYAARLARFDPTKLSESMGEVAEKSDQFVTIRFGRRMHLVPGQTFVVIAPGTSLAEVVEREKELERKHHEFTSTGSRDPFADNERVKGMVEVTNVTAADTAQARITYESQPIRNPITRRDQLFNMALSTGAREPVAFAGIIDLDGDGKPDNEAFIKILEKNNLSIDAFLDLKSGEVKGRGLNVGTRFLILGTDAPMVGNVKKMVDQANKLNVPIVDARRFLALIGIKPPKNPAPPAYSGVTLGGEGQLAPKESSDVLAPPPVPKAEEKKDEPKKDEKKDQ
jgi:hypothetical protein